MRLIAPLLFCMIGAVVGAALSLLFGARGTGVRGGGVAGLIGGFAGLMLRDALDVELGGTFLGAVGAVAAGALAASLAANLALLVTRGARGR